MMIFITTVSINI